MAMDQEQMISTMKEILQEGYLELEVVSYTLHENLAAGTCRLSCKMHSGDEELVVEGEGVGMIDALFNGLRDRLAHTYASLNSISFSEFAIRGLESEGRVESTSSAEATVGITNSEDREFIFKATASSVSHAGVMATVAATKYFVNSEKTFVRLNEILEHYRSEGRTDLVAKYTELMSEVVTNTSYSEVVAQIRQGL